MAQQLRLAAALVRTGRACGCDGTSLLGTALWRARIRVRQ